jgi:purine-cytosine permease-like protein
MCQVPDLTDFVSVGIVIISLISLFVSEKVLLSLSVTGANTPAIYSICMEFQVLIPPLVVVPRYMFSVVAAVV